MGYVRRRVIDLVFTAPSLAGFEAATRPPDLETWLHVRDLTRGGVDLTRANEDRLHELAGIVADHLESWNLCSPHAPGGPPLEISSHAILGQDIEFTTQLLDVWCEQVAAPDVPLDGGSSTGAQADLAALPMDPAPRAQAS